MTTRAGTGRPLLTALAAAVLGVLGAGVASAAVLQPTPAPVPAPDPALVEVLPATEVAPTPVVPPAVPAADRELG